MMKKLLMSGSVLILCASMFACAPATGGDENIKVKCPACGYEFETTYPTP